MSRFRHPYLPPFARASTFVPDPMPAPSSMPPSVPSNIGKRTPLNVQTIGGVLQVNDTQLISARDNSPRQWVITVMQCVAGRDGGVSPWSQNWDGQLLTFPVASPQFFGAPLLPYSQNAMQLRLRWGAGGAAFESRVDYPIAGAAFGITADAVDVDVVFRGTPPTYTNALDVPVVGAFMVPGIAADPTPLRWWDRESGPLNSGVVAVAMWSVKPYARRVRVELNGASTDVDVIFNDRDGAIVSQTPTQGDRSVLLDVPAQASVLQVSNNAATNIGVRVEWYIGLT